VKQPAWSGKVFNWRLSHRPFGNFGVAVVMWPAVARPLRGPSLHPAPNNQNKRQEEKTRTRPRMSSLRLSYNKPSPNLPVPLPPKPLPVPGAGRPSHWFRPYHPEPGDRLIFLSFKVPLVASHVDRVNRPGFDILTKTGTASSRGSLLRLESAPPRPSPSPTRHVNWGAGMPNVTVVSGLASRPSPVLGENPPSPRSKSLLDSAFLCPQIRRYDRDERD